MKIFLKIHSRSNQTVIGACDEDCMDKILIKNNFRFHVSEGFFKGELVSIDIALKTLKSSRNFNAVGKNIINGLVESKIIHNNGVIEIDGIPIALKILF